MVRIPRGFGKLLGNERFAWFFPTAPIGKARYVEVWVRGKTLGGSSSLNGMVYNRGAQADWDGLAAAVGNPAWGWEAILPHYVAMEDNELGASPTRGVGGPLGLSTGTIRSDLTDDMIAAAAAAGMERVDDLNETDGERIGYAMANIKRGRRVSAAAAFLHPVAKRPKPHDRNRIGRDQVALRGRQGRRRTCRLGRRRRRAPGHAGGRPRPRKRPDAEAAPAVGHRTGRGAANRGRGRPRRRAQRGRVACASTTASRSNTGSRRTWVTTASSQARSRRRYPESGTSPQEAAPLPRRPTTSSASSRPNHELDRIDAQILMAPYTIATAEPGAAVGLERSAGNSVHRIRPASGQRRHDPHQRRRTRHAARYRQQLLRDRPRSDDRAAPLQEDARDLHQRPDRGSDRRRDQTGS